MSSFWKNNDTFQEKCCVLHISNLSKNMKLRPEASRLPKIVSHVQLQCDIPIIVNVFWKQLRAFSYFRLHNAISCLRLEFFGKRDCYNYFHAWINSPYFVCTTCAELSPRQGTRFYHFFLTSTSTQIGDALALNIYCCQICTWRPND